MTAREVIELSAISIHAPREGCDAAFFQQFSYMAIFQSTHPVRDATTYFSNIIISDAISIHAPREGCDQKCNKLRSAKFDFNPRTP